MLNEQIISLPADILPEFESQLEEFNDSDLTARIWAKDSSVWTSSGEENWLGWLEIPEKESGAIAKFQAVYSDVAEEGFQNIVLLGMGGSSLCPEVFANTFGKTHFSILDSTVPAQIEELESRIDLPSRVWSDS